MDITIFRMPCADGEHPAAKLAGSRGRQLNRYAAREAARLRSAWPVTYVPQHGLPI